MENLSAYATGIVGIIGFLVSLCTHMLRRRDWPTWLSITLSTGVYIVSFVAIFVFIYQVLVPPEGSPEESQAAEGAVTLQQAPVLGQAVTGVERSVASVAPAARAPVPQMETRELPVNLGKTNDHCAGPRDVRWHVRADDGWEIDVASIDVRATVISSKSSYSRVTDATKDGFYIEGRIVNRGRCVKAFGQVVARDARGTLRVSGRYQETRQVVSASNAR